MKNFGKISLALAAAAFMAASVNAATIATFADPAADGSTPLFSSDGTTLTGGWSGTGLTLQTPGLAIPDVADATFTLTPLNITPVVAGLDSLSGGTIQFFDGVTSVLTITFDAAFLTQVSFGASDLAVQNVTISGSGLPTLTQEQFAFSFANGEQSGGTTTWTAAFTSSAVPEPSSLILLGLGLVGFARRR